MAKLTTRKQKSETYGQTDVDLIYFLCSEILSSESAVKSYYQLYHLLSQHTISSNEMVNAVMSYIAVEFSMFRLFHLGSIHKSRPRLRGVGGYSKMVT